jgi:hypothetical protein
MKAFLVTILLLCTCEAFAADGYIAGIGTKTCNELATSIEKKELNQQDVLNWTQGYFSGANVAYALKSRRDVTAGGATQLARLMDLIKAKCDDRPDYLLSKAVDEVYFELRTTGQ